MALIVLSGLPSSGKSQIATALQTQLEAACSETDLEVKLVDESLLALSRDACYRGTVSHNPTKQLEALGVTLFWMSKVDSVSEKTTRGRLKAAVERALTKTSIVIFDSLNNIKGYR